MLKYFTGSYIVTLLGVIGAFVWGEHINSGSGFDAIFIVLVLAVLETSLSFDNAVVNAMKLEKMSDVWRHRFITWGILIAVFGMRFLFPILVVSIFANIDMYTVAKIALLNSHQYAQYLEATHAPIVTFGGMFLIMLFLNYFFDNEKKIHWIKFIERPMANLDHVRGIEVIISLSALLITRHCVAENMKMPVVISGIAGVITYLAIDGVSHFLEKHEQLQHAKSSANDIKGAGLISFIYLELIDASFSLDGVLGAFALSSDFLIITIGLAIGAMFVRSLTIMLVEKKTLAKFLYLEHGAHWAIGALAIIMLITTVIKVPTVVTGGIGLFFILTALITSIIHNKKLSS